MRRHTHWLRGYLPLIAVLVVLAGCRGSDDDGSASGGSGGGDSGGGSGGGDATVTAESSLGGRIDPARQVVASGETVRFDLTSYDGYEIDQVNGCEGEIVEGDQYRVVGDGADCRVEARFTLDDRVPQKQDFSFCRHLDDPSVNRATSRHFQVVWGNEGTASEMTVEKAEARLAEMEAMREVYVGELGFRGANRSAKPAERDGNRYKVNIHISGGGLGQKCGDGFAFQGYGPVHGGKAFAYIIAEPGAFYGAAMPHEYGHVITQHQSDVELAGGDYRGGWVENSYVGPRWEGLANWLRERYYISRGAEGNPRFPDEAYELSELMQNHGRTYYGNWMVFNNLHENPDDLPGLDDDFMVRLLQDTRRDDTLYQMIQELAPDLSIQDVLGHLAKRMATQDFQAQQAYRNGFQDLLELERHESAVFTPLRAVPGRPEWLRVPLYEAPQQTGFNLIRLQPTSSQVTVDFNGLADDGRGADWRAAIAATNEAGETRYSSLWSDGRNSLDVSGMDAVYLVVTATPDPIRPIVGNANESEEPTKSTPAKQPYPYEVRLDGATVDRPVDEDADEPAGSSHPNGGGFVASSASVAESAYVGPDAAVLGVARVEGDARIEDQAVIDEEATVRDSVVVGGNARVEGRAVVEDDAKVAGYAAVYGEAKVSGRAIVTEKARVRGDAVLQQDGIAKGLSDVYSGTVQGTAKADFDYASNDTLTCGNVFGWGAWWDGSQEYADNRPCQRSSILRYNFDDTRQPLVLDEYGVSHGYLRGSAAVSGGDLRLDSRGGFVEINPIALEIDHLDLRTAVVWQASGEQHILTLGDGPDSRLYLTTSNEDGNLAAVVEYDGETYQAAANQALTAGERTELRVTFSDGVLTLYGDGDQVAQRTGVPVTTSALQGQRSYAAPAAAFLGRGIEAGTHAFAGRIGYLHIQRANYPY
ncbi:MAG: DUF6055 domain-containing protein [Ectothiorhodospiraceae bacterium]